MSSHEPESNDCPPSWQITNLPPDTFERSAALRRRCDEGQDCFTPRERARLQFLRWLIETGRLAA